jgi:hypothetical protein
MDDSPLTTLVAATVAPSLGHSSPASAMIEVTTSAYSSSPTHRTSGLGNGSHSQTLGLPSTRDRPMSTRNTGRQGVFLTGHFPEFLLRKKWLHSILTSCELEAAIFRRIVDRQFAERNSFRHYRQAAFTVAYISSHTQLYLCIFQTGRNCVLNFDYWSDSALPGRQNGPLPAYFRVSHSASECVSLSHNHH